MGCACFGGGGDGGRNRGGRGAAASVKQQAAAATARQLPGAPTQAVVAPQQQQPTQQAPQQQLFGMFAPKPMASAADPWHFGYKTDVKVDYEFGEPIGKGGFGITYKSKNRATAEEVAIKAVDKEKMKARGDKPEYLKREVDVMYKFRGHANVVHMHDAYEDNLFVYIVMEICTGGELFDRIIKRGHYTEKDAAAITRQILQVVALCHLEGIVHRDLKPENFLFAQPTEDAPLKMIDFGLAGQLSLSQAKPLQGSVGTLYYMAPEVLTGKYDVRADVWSVGVIMYVTLCGFFPFYGSNHHDVMKAITYKPVDFSQPPWPDISDSAKQLLNLMLVKDPHARPTAAQCLSHPWVKEGGVAPEVPLDIASIVLMHRFQRSGPMTQLALRAMAKTMSGKPRPDLQDQFDAIDKDHNGVITLDEFSQAAGTIIGGILDKKHIDQIFEAVDDDNDGKISYDEFAAATIRMKQWKHFGVHWSWKANEAFYSIDLDKDGYITAEDLLKVMPADRVELAIKEGDQDGDGKISYKEFLELLYHADDIVDRLKGAFMEAAQQAAPDSTSASTAQLQQQLPVAVATPPAGGAQVLGALNLVP
eukprot:jgi/Chlat1/3123/Chrsp21S03353